MTIFETVLGMSASASVAICAVLALRLVLRSMPKGFTWVLWLAVLARLWCPVFPTVSLEASIPVVEPAEVIGEVFAPAEPAAPVVQDQLSAQTAVPEETADPMEVLALIWAAGAGALALWGIASDLRLRSRLRTAIRREDGVWLADGIDTPFVTGLIFPKIYLPSELDGTGERYILLHERRHIRNFDPVVKLLFFGALCIHWFNPLVWVACWLAERDMELRCDEGVFSKLEEKERADYAAALVSCASRRRRLMPLAFGEGDTKRRVKNVLNYRKPKWWALALAAIICITAAGCMLVDPEPAPERGWVMDFPGLSWGMTAEEVCKALELSEGEYTIDQGDYKVIHDVRMDLFDVENAYIAFYFCDQNGDGTFSFFRVEAVFPHDTDMEAVAREISDYYGVSGILTEEEIINDYGPAEIGKDWDWSSTALQQDIMSKAEFEYVNGQNDYAKRILTNPVTTIFLTTNTYRPGTLDGMSTSNGLTMNSLVPFYRFEGGFESEMEAAATSAD